MPSYKIAMIGDSSTVSGFAAAGVTGFPAYRSEDALAELTRLARSREYAVIFITEGLAEPILSDISRISADIAGGIRISGQGIAKPPAGQAPIAGAVQTPVPVAAKSPALSAIPAIIVIPDQGGSRGIGFKKIRNAVEKALGIDLLGKES